jgi:flagellar biosynthesis chaperone FliJ
VDAVKSLATLIKLQKTYVDEQRQQVARLQDRLAQIEKAIKDLEAQKVREQAAARKSVENSITFGQFIKLAIKRGRELEKERQTAQAAVEIALGKLAELFEEQKRYEIAEERRVEEERRTERRLETIRLDEVGGITHQRQKNE